jgi:hypothetical protein
MIFYPPTLLLPSPPYPNLDHIITSLCDMCLIISEDDTLSHVDIDQYFDVTMSLVDFWFHELEGKSFK